MVTGSASLLRARWPHLAYSYQNVHPTQCNFLFDLPFLLHCVFWGCEKGWDYLSFIILLGLAHSWNLKCTCWKDKFTHTEQSPVMSILILIMYYTQWYLDQVSQLKTLEHLKILCNCHSDFSRVALWVPLKKLKTNIWEGGLIGSIQSSIRCPAIM